MKVSYRLCQIFTQTQRLMESPYCKIAVYLSSYLGNFRGENLYIGGCASPGGFRWRLAGVSRPVITIRTHPLHARSHICTCTPVSPRVGVYRRRRSVSYAISQEV